MEQQYLELLKEVRDSGQPRTDRTGTGTVSLFGKTIQADISKYFPLMTHKKMSYQSIVAELIWFLSGNTNSKILNQLGSTIWDEWADDKGKLGPIYGEQWRGNASQPDQITNIIDLLLYQPDSRRIYVSAWRPEVLPVDKVHPTNQARINKQALAPCHHGFQCYVRGDLQGRRQDMILDMMVHQRSVDTVLGLPYNIASYATLIHILGALTGLKVGVLTMTLGDTHIYNNHLDKVDKLLEAKTYTPPTLDLTKVFRKINGGDQSSIAMQLNNYFDINLEGMDTVERIVHALMDYESSSRVNFKVSV